MQPVLQPPPEDKPYLRRLGWTIAVAALLLVIWRATDLLLLAFGSVLGAVIFRTVAGLLRRAGLRNEPIALAFSIVLVLAAFGAIAWLITVQFGDQVFSLLSDLPQVIQSLQAQLAGSPVGAALVSALEAAAGGSTFADVLGDLITGAGQILLNFLIVLIGAIFLAVHPEPYLAGIVLLTPPKARAAMRRALNEISLALRLWLQAQLIQMASMGLLVAAGLWFVGLDSWAALGLLAGISEFVPYVGPAIAMLPALAIAATQGGNLLWETLLVYLVVRLVQTNLVTPNVTGQVISIPPALTLFVILGVGAVFGIYGLFFSAALLVVAFVGVRELYLRDTLGEDIEGVPRKETEDQAP
ncbi:AI-2E family transporter [Altericroceibacterium xinjiangense]|uniref:AI-2E family transporter n=1 Tax=Altericroceibacterium xinjiangense TaxID=762261 RepID=UPI000F7E3DE9|nr:AI-2E family transporter [Altericroceibacterium xinjiangense]